MTSIRFRRNFAWGLFLIGILMIGLSSWPLPVNTLQWETATGSTSYQFLLDWPALIRAGDTRPATLKITRSDSASGPMDRSEMLAARLEFNNLQIEPSALVTQPAGLGGVNTFRWSLVDRQNGQSQGTLWIYSIQTPAGAEQNALAARPLSIRTVGYHPSFVLTLRWLGVGITIFGFYRLIRSLRE